MTVQLRFDQLPRNQLDDREKTQGHQGQGPVRIDGGRQQRRAQRRYPHPNVGHEAQNPRQGRPEQGVRQSDESESNPDHQPEPAIDGELRDEKSRQTLASVIDGEGGPANIAAPGYADEAVTQRVMFQQNENQHHQHDARRLDRHPDRTEDPFNDLHGIERRFVQLHRNRSVGACGQPQNPALRSTRSWRDARSVRGAQFARSTRL